MINIALVIGRFQPLTKGHVELANYALSSKENNDLVFMAIIEGVKTSEDKTRNPLSGGMREQIIRKAIPSTKLETIICGSANIPVIAFQIIENRVMEPYDKKYHFTIYSGPDRVKAYEAQTAPKYIEQLKSDLNRPDLEITFSVNSDLPKNYDATKLRDAIRAGQDAEARGMLGIEDEGTYDEIKAEVEKGIKKEAMETKIKSILERL
jgi:nicotinamide mononucleotide adenylyltransferase